MLDRTSLLSVAVNRLIDFLVEVVQLLTQFADLFELTRFKRIARLDQVLGAETINESTRASAFNERECFGQPPLSGRETDPDEAVVRGEFVSKECGSEFFTRERRA